MTENERLEQIVRDVKKIKEEVAKGRTVEVIAKELGMAGEYITNIMITVQGYAEDDDLAIARLMLLEEDFR